MKQTVFFLLFFILHAFPLLAQVKFKATPTGKHAKALNTAKSVRAEAKARKEQARQLAEQKKAIDKYQERYADLKEKRLNDIKVDSVAVPQWTDEDSIKLAKEILFETNFPYKYVNYVVNPIRLDSLAMASIDSSAYKPETLLEDELKKFLPAEFAQTPANPLENMGEPSLDSGMLNPTIPNLKKPTKPNPNLLQNQTAQTLFEQLDVAQFAEIQQNITKLKKKYAAIPDTRFPEAARKRNSLEDLPFKKRLHLGGNMGINSTDPFILDANLQLGYWINKKWMTGIGLTVREQLNGQDSVARLTGDGHGFSFFTRYDILKQFYAWGEAQWQVNKSLLGGESTPSTEWQQAHLLGIGRTFRAGIVRMTTLIMYDFNHKGNDLNASPFVFRFGVQFTAQPGS